MMATTKLSPSEIASLLTFPSKTKGLSEYKPGYASSFLSADSGYLADNGSPPRKAQRLEGDIDHSASTSRAKEKGKEKMRTNVSDERSGIWTLTIEPAIEALKMEEDLDRSLQHMVQDAMHLLLVPDNETKPRCVVYERVYEGTRALVLEYGMGQWIYDKLCFELQETTKRLAGSLDPSQKLRMSWTLNFVEKAEWYETRVRILETLLAYVDRVFVFKKAGTPSIRQTAKRLFKTNVLMCANLSLAISESIKEWAMWERKRRQPHPDRQTVQRLALILEAYSMFENIFLKSYLHVAELFYLTESSRLATIHKNEHGKFLETCFEFIDEERQRSEEVLLGFQKDWQQINRTIEHSLLEERLEWLSGGIVSAIDNKDSDSLKKMYDLFSRVDGLKRLCNAFKSHIHKRVASIVTDKARDDEMIERLLDFKAFIDEALPEAFSKSPRSLCVAGGSRQTVDSMFRYAATDAFTSGFRERDIIPAEMIAKYLDREMRRGQKEASDAEFTKKLDSVLGLYRFTQDKDVFRTFFHRALARRLLLQRSASDDFEKSVLKKLKDDYDPEFGMGENMFRDLALSRDFLREFHERDIGKDSAKTIAVTVLQRSSWPFSARKDETILPPSMQSDLSKYVSFYKSRHQGRKLDFDHSLGTASLRARFAMGEKELSVTLHQALVLLLFNEESELAFFDIKEQIRIEDADLRRTLQSLACGKKKVLLKRPASREVEDNDVFVFNNNFTDPHARIQIKAIHVKETYEESRKAHTLIEGDRKAYLDAAIVRMMKANKTMSHQALVAATIDAVKAHFKPDVPLIKARFDYLISADYMKRDEDEPNVYVYVA